jgi:hypothetical protein
MEAPVKDTLVWFDGEVLEIFGRDAKGSGRYHASLISNAVVDDGVATITYASTDYTILSYLPEQEPALKALLDAVLAARGG